MADEISNLIGNMILLKGYDNSTLGNKGFDKKFATYRSIKIIDCANNPQLYILSIQKQSEWTLDFAKKRSENILRRFCDEFLLKI